MRPARRGEPELAWQLFIGFGVALMVSYAQTAEVLASYELLASLPPPKDPTQAALALGVWSWARASVFDPAAAVDLESACGVLEEAGERELLGCFLTAWGMLLAPSSLSVALGLLDRALLLARAQGQTVLENWVLMTICYAQLYGGAIDEAERYAAEFAAVAERRRDDEARAYALGVEARIKVVRGDLAGARTLFADVVALASARSAAWARDIALCGLASATLAAGDESGARAVLEEALLVCAGAGYLRVDSLCGALALLLVKSGEEDRAARVFAAVAAGAESDTSFHATSTDPSGALRTATSEARALLGDPPPCDPARVDLDAVLQAALGTGRDRPWKVG